MEKLGLDGFFRFSKLTFEKVLDLILLKRITFICKLKIALLIDLEVPMSFFS